MNGYYHSIETFGTVDGPGIRYVLFLSGCQLCCSFCHNPDTWQQGNQKITPVQVLADVKRYRKFYDQSGGGITVSGGEPLLQANFVAELFYNCKKQGINTLLDTSGYANLENFKIVLPYTDHIQFSIKAIDELLHKRLTAQSNIEILENLSYVAMQNIPITIRYVVIPGITGTNVELRQLADLVKRLPDTVTVEILGYHTMGLEKWRNLKMKYPLADVQPATDLDLENAKNILCEQGVQTC